MKLTPQQKASTLDDNFNERCSRNQSVFSDFIDLIPSKIYLNPEDHGNWTRFAIAENKHTKKNIENGHTETSDGEENENEDDDVEEVNRVNKFDPRVFKTVSQIFKDFQLMEERVI